MMLLPQQIQAIIFHFLMGWLYGCLFFILLSFMMYLRSAILKGIIEIAFHIAFVLGMFYGLYQINGGITNGYLVAFFLAGTYVFFRLYINVIIQFVNAVKNWMRPFVKKIKLVKSKILGIMKLSSSALKRRKMNGKKRKKQKRRAKDEEITFLEEDL